MRFNSFVLIAVSVIGASAVRAQGAETRSNDVRTNADLFGVQPLSLDRYARSLDEMTLVGNGRQLADSRQLRLKALFPSDTTFVKPAVVQPPLPAACPMPVFKRDTADFTPMPVMAREYKGQVAGTIVGCQNTLQPER
ncbi:MAG: hypothetical protein IBJ03_15785 [Gemmatimonadaceae bacterium]|nr:hypothetical protein [Gemmatimonadaceae bacterium]